MAQNTTGSSKQDCQLLLGSPDARIMSLLVVWQIKCSLMRIMLSSNSHSTCIKQWIFQLLFIIISISSLKSTVSHSLFPKSIITLTPIYLFPPFQQQFIIVFLTRTLSKMNYPQKALTLHLSYDEDSEDESMFHVPTPQPDSPKISWASTNRRLIGKHNSWKIGENQQYIQFLKDYFDILSIETKTERMGHVYCMMSAAIKSKNYAQCRIHHYRMMSQYKTAERVIQQMERRLRNPLGRLQKLEEYSGLKVAEDDEWQRIAGIETEDFWSVLDFKCEEQEQSGFNI